MPEIMKSARLTDYKSVHQNETLLRPPSNYVNNVTQWRLS